MGDENQTSPVSGETKPAPLSTGPERAPAKASFLTYLFGAAAVAFLVLAGWQMAVLASVRGEAGKQLDATKREAAKEVDTAKRDTLLLAALSAAAGVEPVLTFKGQLPEITDRTLQTVCENILKGGRYSFVAIVDNSGKILACSDLAQIGANLPGFEPGKAHMKEVEGVWEASAPVPQDSGALGAVVLRSKRAS